RAARRQGVAKGARDKAGGMGRVSPVRSDEQVGKRAGRAGLLDEPAQRRNQCATIGSGDLGGESKRTAESSKEVRAMTIKRKEQGANRQRSTRTILASLAALGGVGLASSCCLPLAPFLLAAGTAGSSAFFVKFRPILLAASVLLIGFGFYQSWRARQC